MGRLPVCLSMWVAEGWLRSLTGQGQAGWTLLGWPQAVQAWRIAGCGQGAPTPEARGR